MLQHSGSASTSAARTRAESAFACVSGAGELPIAVPPGGRGVVRRQFQRAYARAGRSLAGDQGSPPHPHRRADRLRQNARGLPRGDRRSGAARPRGRADRRNPCRLRLPAQGAVERHPSQPRGPARRHPRGTEAEWASRRRNPHLGPNRRHARVRTRADAPPPAAYSRDDAGIALCPARLRVRAQDAGDGRDRDRRRNPRHGAEQARRPPRRLARTPLGPVRRPALAHRPFRHAKSDSRGCAFPGRRGAGRRAGRGGRDHRRRASAPARPYARNARFAAGIGDVGRNMDASLRAPRGTDRGAPHDAGVRQHPPHGRAHRSRADRASRRARRHRASRQHGERAEARGRAAAEARRIESAGRDRLARARDRYRRCQSRLPARFAALDCDLSAAGRPVRPRHWRHAQGAPLSALARRSRGMRRAHRQRPARASSTA